MRNIVIAVMLAASVAACAGATPQSVNEVGGALSIASTVEAVYAARNDADPKKVAAMKSLLAAAQAAFASWSSAGAQPSAKANVDAAIAALVAYEATL